MVIIDITKNVCRFIDFACCFAAFPIGLVKTGSGFIVRSVETGLGR